MTHEPICNWEKTKPSECEYRETHHYCPHPEHACNCVQLRKDHPMREVEEKDGKTSITTKHEDGRQDVEIQVSRLNIENRTPEDTIAEGKIIDAMSKKIVRVVVIHKPTNESANFDSPLPLVRKRAEEVVKAYNRRLAEKLGVGGAEAPKSEFVVVEFDAGQVRVSSL